MLLLILMYGVDASNVQGEFIKMLANKGAIAFILSPVSPPTTSTTFMSGAMQCPLYCVVS